MTPTWLAAIASRSPALATRLRGGRDTLPRVRALDHGPRLGAIVTFAVEGRQPQPFKAAMDARLIDSALSFREFAQFDFGDKDVDRCPRLSPHHHNTEEETDRVVAAVAELSGTGGRGHRSPAER